MSDKIRDKQYLGDGVYAYFDGYQIWLKTERDTIALEPEVFHRLVSYTEHLRQKYSKVVK